MTLAPYPEAANASKIAPGCALQGWTGLPAPDAGGKHGAGTWSCENLVGAVSIEVAGPHLDTELEGGVREVVDRGDGLGGSGVEVEGAHVGAEDHARPRTRGNLGHPIAVEVAGDGVYAP